MSTRKLFFASIILLTLAFVSVGLVSLRRYPKHTLTQNVPVPFVYTVMWGDTLASIAAKFGVTISDLLAANDSCSNCIYASQTINVPVMSTVVIEAEWPTEMEINRSDTIRLSLIQGSDQSYSASTETRNHTAVAVTSLPIDGTPTTSIKEAFGSSYEVCAVAGMAGLAFDFSQPTTIECKSLSQNSVVWDWSILPKNGGPQSIISSIEFRWIPTTSNGKTIQREIWRYRFDTNVKTPFITAGQLNVAALVSGLLGSLLSIPWIYEKIIETKKQKRKPIAHFE